MKSSKNTRLPTLGTIYTHISAIIYMVDILFDSEIYTTFTAYYNRESDCDLHIPSHYDVF